MTTENYDAGAARSGFIILLGVVAAILGAAGTLGISKMLAWLVPKLISGEYPFLSHLALFQFMWAVFFVSLLIAGIKLVISGIRRKRHDIVPGLTLYFLGVALIVNGLLMFIYGHTLYAGVTVLIGALVSYIEWSTEVV